MLQDREVDIVHIKVLKLHVATLVNYLRFLLALLEVTAVFCAAVRGSIYTLSCRFCSGLLKQKL